MKYVLYHTEEKSRSAITVRRVFNKYGLNGGSQQKRYLMVQKFVGKESTAVKREAIGPQKSGKVSDISLISEI